MRISSRPSRLPVPGLLLFFSVGALGACGVGAADQTSSSETQQAPALEARPQFTDDGSLLRPEGWRGWAMVGASLNLSYAEPGPGEAGGDMQMFHRVYMQPWAYEHFLEEGEFAEETMFMLEFYDAADDAHPARGGLYEGERLSGFEVHMKKRDLNETGWGFYMFSDTVRSAQPVPVEATCYTCHSENAATDNVFTQFYPELREKVAATVGTPPAAAPPPGGRD